MDKREAERKAAKKLARRKAAGLAPADEEAFLRRQVKRYLAEGEK